MDPRTLTVRLEGQEQLDAAAGPLRDLADAVPSGARSLLRGDALGHPLHPALTDLPIGFWTSAWLLDLVGGRRRAGVATAMVGLGVAAALPTAAAGLVDWSEMGPRRQRVGVVHAVGNLAATALYGASFLARIRGRRGRGILLGWAGAAAATAGAYLGGHLAFGTRQAALPVTTPDALATEADPRTGPRAAPPTVVDGRRDVLDEVAPAIRP